VSAPSATEVAGAEEQVRAVVAYLRHSFDGALNDQDREDLAQSAYCKLLEKQRDGEEIRSPVELMKVIAWREARAHAQAVTRPRPHDPSGHVISRLPSSDPTLEERLDERARLALAIAAVEELPTMTQAVYRTKVVEELSIDEACRRLDLPRSTFYWHLRQAAEAVAEIRTAAGAEATTTKLLSVYLTGAASARERRSAERLLAADPRAVSIARELRHLHEGAAAAIPAGVLDHCAHLSLADHVAAAAPALRDRITGVGTERSFGEVATQATSSGAARGAGAGAGGLIAQLASAGTTAKIVAACLAGGAAATTCAVTGLVPGIGVGGDRSTPTPAHHAPAVAIHKPPRLGAASFPAPPRPPEPPTQHTSTTTPAPPPAATTTTTPTVTTTPIAPSAPPAQQEFGVASAATTTTSSSGGSSSGGGSATKQEFGQP
jgi:DNA-directed RNA polymerase specialized sigma24 family protein